MDKRNYVYIYLDQRKPGRWEFQDKVFDFEPFYVGIGVRNRIMHHFQNHSLKKRNTKNDIIWEIIKETESKPIHFKIFENLSRDKAEEIEKQIISKFGRLCLESGCLSNLSEGGDECYNIARRLAKSPLGGESPISKTVYQYTLDGSLVKHWNSMVEAARHYNCHPAAITQACNGKNRTCKGFIWKRGESLYKREEKRKRTPKIDVYVYTLDGKFVCKCKSMTEAGIMIGRSPSVVKKILSNPRPLKRLNFQIFLEYKGEFTEPANIKEIQYIGVSKGKPGRFQMSIIRGGIKLVSKVFHDVIKAAECYDKISLYIDPENKNINFPERKDEFLKENLKEFYETTISSKRKK